MTYHQIRLGQLTAAIERVLADAFDDERLDHARWPDLTVEDASAAYIVALARVLKAALRSDPVFHREVAAYIAALPFPTSEGA